MKICWVLACFISVAVSTDCRKESIKAKNVPEVIPIHPQFMLKMAFGKTDVTCGDTINLNITKTAPTIELYRVNDDIFYSIYMIDPDAPYPNNRSLANYLHWLVINIPGKRVESGNVLADYEPPNPPSDSEPHRYLLVLYEQPCFYPHIRRTEPRTNFKKYDYFFEDGVTPYPYMMNFFYGKQ